MRIDMTYIPPHPRSMRGARRRIGVGLISLLLLLLCDATAQPPADSVRPWYDTLQITKPRYAHQTRYERLMLHAFTALSLPVGMVVGLTTVIPPSVSFLAEEGNVYAGVALSSGTSFGGDPTQMYYFPDARLQGEIAYYFEREQSIMLRGSAHLDHRFGAIDSRNFYWLGVSGGAGVATDFKGIAPYAEGWFGVMNPLGIRYLGLFPMHHYGFRGRAGYDVVQGRPWYEFSFTATSTFGK